MRRGQGLAVRRGRLGAEKLVGEGSRRGRRMENWPKMRAKVTRGYPLR